jgi:2-keto-4-pentenoate hydratase/2-oxohepta-3-ene-1,7-dioic acid hydratase in catechol pathway
MIHNIPELIEYASSLITLFPGDVLQSGTSGGTGAGRVERASGSGYLVDGETIEARIEGIGSLRHRVVRERGVPDDLSGAQLPRTCTYRGAGC